MPRWRLWSDFSPRARLAIACGTLIILFCMLFRRGVQDLGLAGRARLAAAWSLGASANRSQQGAQHVRRDEELCKLDDPAAFGVARQPGERSRATGAAAQCDLAPPPALPSVHRALTNGDRPNGDRDLGIRCVNPSHPDPAHSDYGAESSSFLWAWPDASRRCGVTTLGARDAARVLGSARVAFVGDSIVRETLRALGDLVATRDAPPPDFLRHAHAAAATPCGGELLFRWRPFADNATAELRERAGAVPPPEVAAPGGAVDARPLDTLVLGVGLWDVLHTRDVSTYAAALKTTFGALETLLREPALRPRLGVFWITLTSVFREHLTDPAKAATMTAEAISLHRAAADAALAALRVRLKQRGGEISSRSNGSAVAAAPPPAIHVVDIGALTAACGPACTEDGIHFTKGGMYCVAAQTILNVMARVREARRREIA